MRSLSAMAQLFFIKLVVMANDGGGYIRVGTVCVDIERAAMALGVCGDVGALAEEMIGMGLLADNDVGWFVPEMKKAAELREKRRLAGVKGGYASVAKARGVRPARVVSSVCLSKAKNPIKSGDCNVAAKSTKKYNNKYIYIFSEKVFIGDRGQEANKPWMSFDNFTVFRRDYEALRRTFPEFSEDRLDELLHQHNGFLDNNPAYANDNWLAPLLSYLRKQHNALVARNSVELEAA